MEQNVEGVAAREEARLAALYRYQLLDTPQEIGFDRLTRLTAQLFEVPMALVSLVDRNRIWFKSHFGLELEQVERTPGLCASAILSEQIYTISDTFFEPLCKINPLVIGETSVRFYAAAPLRSSEDYVLGTFCIMDTRPRQFAPSRLAALGDFADLVMEQLELRLERATSQNNKAYSTTWPSRELDQVLSASPDRFFIYDRIGRYLYANPISAQILGLEREELIGKTWQELGFPAKFMEPFDELRERVFQTGQVQRAETDFPTKNGLREYEYILSPIFEPNTKLVAAVVSTVRDITESKRVETALRESEARFRLIAETIEEAFWLIDPIATKLIYISPAYEKMTGYSAQSMYEDPDTFQRAIHSNDLQRVIAKLPAQLSGGYVDEYRMLRADGSLFWVRTQAFPVRDEMGQVYLIAGLSEDITLRKNIELALIESEVRFRTLVENLTVGILLQGPKAEIMVWNQTALELLGLTESQLMGTSSYDPEWNVIHEDGSPFPGESHPVPQAIATKQPVQGVVMGVYRPSRGDRVWLLVNATPQFNNEGAVSQVICTFSDITQLKQAEEARRRSDELYRTLARTLPGATILLYDHQLRFLIAEGAALSQHNYSKEAMIGRSLWETIPAHNASELAPYYLSALAGQERSFEIQREEYSFLVTTVPVRNEQGEVFAGMVVSQDITRLKQAEKVLAAEKERLSVTLRSIGDAVITTDTEGKVTLLNKKAEKLTDWPNDQAINRPLGEIFHIINEKTGQPMLNPITKVLETGQIVHLTNHTALIARDGTRHSIADSGAPIFDQTGQIIGAVLVFRDVTHERLVNQELLKASKLESLSVLAGGIAHDFNNLLATVMGNLALAKLSLEPSSPALEFLEEGEKATWRTKDLTQQLLTFAKGGMPVKKAVLLPQVVKDSAQFALHGSNVEAEFNLPPNLWPVEIDEGQIGQVIQNLVINAVQAMTNGGKIRIALDNFNVESELALPLVAGRYIKITIQDEGSGIRAEDLPKIFDPYFTTKPQGSGLGLAVCYSILKNHDGYIEVESKLDIGTSFYLYLPAVTKPSSTLLPVKSELIKGTGRLLVMDDEATVRHALGKVLEMLGYEVVLSKNGLEALVLYQEALATARPFSAVIMDLTIPGGLGGKECISRLLEIDPQARVIVCSGYSTDPIMSNYKSYGFRGVISKPFKMEELAQVVYHVCVS